MITYYWLTYIRDEVNLFDGSDELVSAAKWSNADYGSALHRLPDGTYSQLPEIDNVVRVLEAMGDYTVFLDAIKVTKLPG